MGTGGRARDFPPLPRDRRPELTLLLACLRSRFDASALDEVRAAAHAGVDGARFGEIARRHRLGAVSSRAMRDAGLADHPCAVDVNLAARISAVRGLRLTSGLAETVDLLGDAGIRPLALKGPVMATELYGDVGLRPSGDLDLLVRPHQLTTARRALAAAGFRPDPDLDEQGAIEYLAAGFAYAFRDDARDLVVEIHPSLAHRTFRYAPDMEALWQRARERTIAGRRILAMAPEDRMLFLCVHGAKHEWYQLIWVCDVAEALRAEAPLDWDEVARLAVDTGSLRMLRLGLHLAHEFTGVPVPLGSATRSTQARMAGLSLQAWSRMLDPIERRPSLWRQLRFHLAIREGSAARREQTREKLVDHFRAAVQRARITVSPSDTDRAFVPLPRGLSFLYFLVRPVRYAMRLRARVTGEKAFPHRDYRR
jgi:hypothetical protein